MFCKCCIELAQRTDWVVALSVGCDVEKTAVVAVIADDWNVGCVDWYGIDDGRKIRPKLVAINSEWAAIEIR